MQRNQSNNDTNQKKHFFDHGNTHGSSTSKSSAFGPITENCDFKGSFLVEDVNQHEEETSIDNYVLKKDVITTKDTLKIPFTSHTTYADDICRIEFDVSNGNSFCIEYSHLEQNYLGEGFDGFYKVRIDTNGDGNFDVKKDVFR